MKTSPNHWLLRTGYRPPQSRDVNITAQTITAEPPSKLLPKAVFEYNVVPVAIESGVLRAATDEPLRQGLMDAPWPASGYRVRLALAPSSDIAKTAKKF